MAEEKTVSEAPRGTGFYTPAPPPFSPAPKGTGFVSQGGGNSGGGNSQISSPAPTGTGYVSQAPPASVKTFEQSSPKAQVEFLNKIQPAQVQAQARAADQQQMAAALGLGTIGVPADVSSRYAESQAFREKRAAQVEAGARGTDVSYPTGVKSPIYSENVSTAMTKGGSVFIGGVGGYEFKAPPAPQQAQGGMSPAPQTGQLFSPMAQADLNAIQTRQEFAAASVPGVVGGASLATGGYFSLIERPAEIPMQAERKSIFNLEPAVNQYGNVKFRETVTGAVEYGFERATRLAEPVLFPALSMVPKQVKEPVISFGKSLVGGAASGTILVSPFGLGEAIGTIGNQPQQQRLMIEFGGAALVGGVAGRVFPMKTGIPQYRVSSSGYVPFSAKPTEAITSTRFTVERAPPGFIARSTTDVPSGGIVSQGGRVVGEYTESGLVTRTVTPFTSKAGSFVKIQEVSQMPVGGFTKTKVQQFAVKMEEAGPQRQFVASEATLFNMPRTFPMGTTLTSQRYGEGVLFKTATGEFVSRTPTSDFATGGLFVKGQKIFVSDELGRVSGVSQVPVQFREMPAGGKPGSGAKFIPPGNYQVQISREIPKQTTGIPNEIPTVQYSKVEAYKPPRVEVQTRGGQAAIQTYDIRSYDKPISASEIQATVPRMATAPTSKASTGIIPMNFIKYAEAVSEKQSEMSRFDTRVMQITPQKTGGRMSVFVGQSSFTGGISGIISPQVIIPRQTTPQTTGTITAQTFPQTFPSFGSVPFMKPPVIETPGKPKLEFPNLVFPEMSGGFEFGKKTKREKGKYQPSFIAVTLGIRGKPGKSEMTGFAIRPVALAGKKKRGKK